jgi:transcription elongation factor S-II
MSATKDDINSLVDAALFASKSLDDPAQHSRVIDALKALKQKPITISLLAATMAPKRLKTLTKHPNEDIKKAAIETIASWKQIARKEETIIKEQVVAASQKSKEEDDRAAAPPLVASPAYKPGKFHPSTKPSQAPTSVSTTTASQGTTTSKNINDGADAEAGSIDPEAIPKAGDTVRDKIRANLATALVKTISEGVDIQKSEIIKLAVEIEVELLKVHNGISVPYKNKFRQLHFNLKNDKNPDLRRKVVVGEITPDILVELTAEELASDVQKEETAKIREKKLFDSAPSSAKQATTDQFQCAKCKERKCTYYQMQTRSADEPMTTFVSCLNCNNRWKFC